MNIYAGSAKCENQNCNYGSFHFQIEIENVTIGDFTAIICPDCGQKLAGLIEKGPYVNTIAVIHLRDSKGNWKSEKVKLNPLSHQEFKHACFETINNHTHLRFWGASYWPDRIEFKFTKEYFD